MKTPQFTRLLIFLTLFAGACSAPGPISTSPPTGENATGIQPPDTSEAAGTTETASTPTPADPYAGLVFREGWARVTGNAAVFGSFGASQMNDVAAGGVGIVAVGYTLRDGDLDAEAWYSTDGVTWSLAADSPDLSRPGTQMMDAVVYGPAGFVAVGSEVVNNISNAAVWRSADGTSWSRVQPDNPAFGDENSQEMTGLAAYGDGYVAVGSENTPDETRGAVWVSPDGSSWQRVPHDPAVFGGADRYIELYQVLPVGSSLLATGVIVPAGVDDIDGGLWFSFDGGLSWTEIDNSAQTLGDPGDPRYQLPGGLIQTQAGFFMVGTEQNTNSSPFDEYTNGLIWHSEDGLNWVRVFEHKPDFHQQHMADIAAFSEGYFVVGFDVSGDQTQAAVWRSADGLTWTEVQHYEGVFGGAGLQKMSAVSGFGDGAVAVGSTTEGGQLEAAVWIYLPGR